MKEYITYWNDVADELDNLLSPDASQATTWLFFPSTIYTTTNASMFNAIQEDMIPKDDSRDSPCGIACGKPKKFPQPLRKCCFK
jgi:hypothetical protein